MLAMLKAVKRAAKDASRMAEGAAAAAPKCLKARQRAVGTVSAAGSISVSSALIPAVASTVEQIGHVAKQTCPLNYLERRGGKLHHCWHENLTKCDESNICCSL